MITINTKDLVTEEDLAYKDAHDFFCSIYKRLSFFCDNVDDQVYLTGTLNIHDIYGDPIKNLVHIDRLGFVSWLDLGEYFPQLKTVNTFSVLFPPINLGNIEYIETYKGILIQQETGGVKVEHIQDDMYKLSNKHFSDRIIRISNLE
jgi:hypothetical protein